MTDSTGLKEVLRSSDLSEPDACRLSQVSYSDWRREQSRWQMLVFVMGCVFALSLLAAIVLFMLDSDTRAAALVAAVGTVVSGVVTTWIVKQRNDASTEKEKALKLVEGYCKKPEETLKGLDEGAAPAELVVP